MDTAKMMIYNPQPIKCVEAVFLALYLTAGIADTERIPLGFKSELHGQVHQHIVLLVRYNNRYGAFGISRQKNLMSKEFAFESLSSIVDNFKQAYEKFDHKVIRIRVGLPVEHNTASFNFVCWRYLSLDPSSTPWEQCSEALEKHINQAKRLWERWLLDGQRENRRADSFLRNLDVKSTVEIQENKLRKRMECNSGSSVKAVKRRQEPDKQEPCMKLVKRRQELREIPSAGNVPNQSLSCKIATRFTGRCKGSPLLLPKVSPREPLTASKLCSRCHMPRNVPPSARRTPETYKKKMRKITLKCHSMELFPGSSNNTWSGSQSDHRTPKLYLDQDRKHMGGEKGNIRKCELRMPVECVAREVQQQNKLKSLRRGNHDEG
ncbi:hypothetical protein GOP47_0028375 [Adiantum capillus-veneris]|nr:hypothetical protein GOP47_0028375 [Adiantum capillus-veneris]